MGQGCRNRTSLSAPSFFCPFGRRANKKLKQKQQELECKCWCRVFPRTSFHSTKNINYQICFLTSERSLPRTYKEGHLALGLFMNTNHQKVENDICINYELSLLAFQARRILQSGGRERAKLVNQ